MSLNLVCLIGNLTRDPEIKYTPSGTACAEFGLAVNEVWFDEAGTKKESVCFVDCTAWKKGAEWAEKYLKKGAEVHITGRLKLDQWEDKETGGKRSKLKVTVDQFTPTFGTWKDGSKPRDEDAGSTRAPAQRSKPAAQPKERDPDLDPPRDDIPY